MMTSIMAGPIQNRMGKPHTKEPKLLPGPSGGRMGVMNQKDQLSQPVFFAIK
jgi:hypothetical protein